MVLEHALLQVVDGREAAFEEALAKAKPLISASPGFRGLEVRRGCEQTGRYLLLVHWDSIADHRDGFRKSNPNAPKAGSGLSARSPAGLPAREIPAMQK